MKYTNSQSEGAGRIGKGFIQRWVGCVLGVVLFLAAAVPVALADSPAMTQKQYIQWMATICGDRLSSSSSDADLANWARGKGMTPTGGWQLGAKLSKTVLAQTIVQLLNLAPRKGTFDAVRILEREGIIISSTGGFITLGDFTSLIDDGFHRLANPNKNRDNDDDDDNGLGDGEDDDDGGPSRDDDDGPRPTGTKPGNGHGDGNHDHTGPPGLSNGPKPGKGNRGNR